MKKLHKSRNNIFKKNVTVSLIVLSSVVYAGTCINFASAKVKRAPAPQKTLKGWHLNASNTGLAGAGIDRNSLPEYKGNLENDYWKPARGEVIRMKKITRPLWLINGNITIDRCWFQPKVPLAEGLITTYNFNDGWTPSSAPSYIYDSDLDGTALTAVAASRQCAVRGLADIKRCNIYGMGTGIAIFSYALKADCVVEGNFVHDLRAYGDPAKGGSHNESFTIRSYLGNSLIIRNNRFIDKTGNDSGAIFIQPYSTSIQHVLVEGNLLESYNYCIFIMNYGKNTYSDFKVKNNRFVRGGFGPHCVNDGVGFAAWADNYYHDPADADHKGAMVDKPKKK
jgi:hypothetical protein